MSKRETRGTGSSYEVIDNKKVQNTVNLLVDFAQKKKLSAKLVMLAMEIIVDKIKTHLQIETVSIQDISDKIH